MVRCYSIEIHSLQTLNHIKITLTKLQTLHLNGSTSLDTYTFS